MMVKSMLSGLAGLLFIAPALVAQSNLAVERQSPGSAKSSTIEGHWRTPKKGQARTVASAAGSATSLEAHRVRPAKAAVPVRSGGKDMLPNDHGQVWRQYDIGVYTEHVQGIERPEQAVVDWILRETGTDVWFRQPLGLLNADKTTISVYHTPDMQQVVADVVGRFVHGSQDAHVLALRLASVNSPNWRSTFLPRLRPISVQSAGIDAWLVSKEDAALLLAQLRRRTDFRDRAAPNLIYFNGQPATISQLRPRNYVHSYRTRPQAGWTGYEAEMDQLQEGFTLQISPLLSQDERTIDAVIKCNIDQVEKLVAVPVELPGLSGQRQRAEIQVPQLVSWRLHERFRWPTDQVLLLSCGVIATPGPERATAFGIPNPFSSQAGRADALLFIESRGKASQALITGATTTVGGQGLSHGARY